jgi:homoserine/homoserine lactone efflux protein
MASHSYFAFVLATTALLLIPGPNVALIVANSVAHGTRYGLLTVLGTSSAMVLQLGLTVLGMTTALDALAAGFGWLRWLGVAYLAFLAVQQWRARPVDLVDGAPEPKSVRTIYARAFFVSLTNPKTLLFYGAFLPQFVTLDARSKSGLWLLSATFLGLALCFDSGWAILAGRVRGFLSTRRKLQRRATGSLLLGAALGLALARRK